MCAKRAQKPAPAGDIPDACPSRRKRVTTGDVARRAGVSQATVSIVLTNRRDIQIPESTRERVKKCAEQLGYLPSLLGEGFLRGRSKIIGVLLLSDSYLPLLNCIAGIQNGVAQHDYVTIVLSSYWKNGYAKRRTGGGDDPEGELAEVRRLLKHQVEGALYLSADLKRSAASLAEFARRRIPVVAMGIDHPASNIDFVGGDNRAVGEMAADHLLAAGCTSFAMVKTPLFPPINKLLAASFCARLKAAGRACREFVADEDDPEGFERRLSRIIRPPTGIFAASEITASLASQTAIRLGWRVPDDVAIVGASSSTFARCSLVPITTIDRNAFASGRTAVELVIRRINGDDGPPQKILTRPILEIRQSSMRPGSPFFRPGTADAGNDAGSAGE